MELGTNDNEENTMLDIGKFTRYGRLNMSDPDGNMFDLDHWSPHTARECAEREGLALTDEHWPILLGLRDIYRHHGDSLSAREVSRYLEAEFSAEGGRRHLYELFPGGPVSQASRIAGIPLPPHSADLSFGSIW
ncbi:MAG: TusE/DsrC/DsvC family sulfur relay protein [Rhodocyclaceae bacterium]|nr:TusE/DsrC/DsvC family sulfur relay protein [Rhodocyclaceae bacterium]